MLDLTPYYMLRCHSFLFCFLPDLVHMLCTLRCNFKFVCIVVMDSSPSLLLTLINIVEFLLSNLNCA